MLGIFILTQLLIAFLNPTVNDFINSFWMVNALLVILFLLIIVIVQQIKLRNKEKENFTTFINAMVDFVIYKDGNGRWLEANNVCLKLFELESVNYKGKNDRELADFTTPFYRDILLYCQTSNEKAWENGVMSRYDEIFPQSDGSNKYFDTIKVPIFNDDGSRRGLVVIGREITDKKNAEEQLRKSEKLSIVGELAASVGHEIRNPLTSIKGFIQLLRKDEVENTFYYDIMLKELDRINQIVSELLILAKPQKLDFSNNDVIQLLTDVVSLIEAQANMNNVFVQFVPQGQCWIDCEPNKLKQLFINIIKNAVEASSENGNVSISVEEVENNYIQVFVQDQGQGIPELFRNRLGEPFYSSKEKGTGLGLTVSHKIVEQHQGEIKFTSQQNKGTSVEILLPKKNELQMKSKNLS